MSLHLKNIETLSKNQNNLRTNENVLGDIIKNEKREMHFTKSQGVKMSTWSTTYQYQTGAKNSVPSTKEYEKNLTKIKKTLKHY